MTDDSDNSDDTRDRSTVLEKTRLQLLQQNQQGSLATLSDKHPSFPFVSVAPYALIEADIPVFLFSSLSVHSRNLRRDSHASLLVSESSSDSNLSEGRVTLIGKVLPVEPEEKSRREEAASQYLKAHPASAQWMSFGDFAFYRMEIIDSYIVAGFGTMGWVS